MKKLIGIALLGLTAFFGVQSQGSVIFTNDNNVPPQKTPEYFLGAGTEFIYSINREKSVNNSPERVQVLKDLKLQSLRGPAGTIATWYLWKKGYMFTPDEPDYHKYYDKDYNKGKGKGLRPVMLDELYEEAGKLNIPYVFNVNVETQSPEDIAEMVKEIKKLSSKPVFLEMGNELFEPGDRKAFPTCREYIAKVRAIGKAVKAVDPTVQIAVVCPSYPFSEDKMLNSALRKLANTGNKPIDHYLEWDDILAANQDIFDAIILHPYIFFRVENSTPESVMAFMAAWNAAGEEVLRSDYAKTFPSKKIWMTEFNVLCWRMFSEKKPELQNRLQLMKSPGAAVANMESLLRFISAGNVSMTHLHTFADGQGFGIVQAGPKGLVKLPNYYIYEAMGKLLAENQYYYRINAPDSPSSDFLLSYTHVLQGAEEGLVRYHNVGAWGFGTEKVLRQVVFQNRTPYEQKVGLGGSKLQKIWSYGGRNPFPNFLRNTLHWTHPPLVENIPVPDRENGQAATELTLPPYSMTIANVIN